MASMIEFPAHVPRSDQANELILARKILLGTCKMAMSGQAVFWRWRGIKARQRPVRHALGKPLCRRNS